MGHGVYQTVVHNRTVDILIIKRGDRGVYRTLTKLRPGRKYILRTDSSATYIEYMFGGETGSKYCTILTSDDCAEWRSIDLVPRGHDAFVSRADDPTEIAWKGMIRRGKQSTTSSEIASRHTQSTSSFETSLFKWMFPGHKQSTTSYDSEDALYLAARNDASEKLEAVVSLSVGLEKDLKRVVIYRAQCANLVQFCSERVPKLKTIFSLISDDQMWRLFQSKKLQQLAKSSDNLLRALLSAQELLKGCEKREWRRAALVLSLPPPDPQNLEKYSGSKFAHVIRELGWSFDLVRYAMSEDGTESFKWDDERDRYVLQGKQLEIGVACDEMGLLQGDIDRETCDREDLLRYLKNGSLKENIFISLAGCFGYISPNEILAATVQNRYQNQFFDIDHLDLIAKNRISKGGDKKVHRGEWLGLEVAIAIIEYTPREAVEREAGFMVRVHHPNVVDFFGCAFKKEEGTGAAQEDQEDQWTAFLVMELMEEDLGHLIGRNMKLQQARRSDFGGPFSLSVTVDILMQIVEAMIHSHKHQIMHRDLKLGNCLVSKKVASRADIDAYYIVKLTDFGISKLWESEIDIHTRRKGTVQYMAPEVWDGGEYTSSTDVYSFGMVCYEVITGSKPLASKPFSDCKNNEEKFDLLRGGERPRIPGTCPGSLSILMKKCWAATPDDRPTFKAIRKDLLEFKLLIDADIEI